MTGSTTGLAEPNFLLLRPEHLPTRTQVSQFVSSLPGYRAALAEAALLVDDRQALGAVTQLLDALPSPAEVRIGDPDPGESAGNRDNDQAFGIVRVDGDRPALLLRSVLGSYLILLDEVVRSGTRLTTEQWTVLRCGFTALLGHLAGFPVSEDCPMAQAIPRRDDTASADALRRWVRGHRLFMVIVQGLGLAIAELNETGSQPAEQAAVPLGLAITLLRASEEALRFASDFTSAEYYDQVRPTLTPPVAPAGMSGLHWRDHEYLLKQLAMAGSVLRGLAPELQPMRRQFRQSYADVYDAHQLVCARFVGTEATSLLMTPKSKQSAVGVLGQYKRVRLQHIPD